MNNEIIIITVGCIVSFLVVGVVLSWYMTVNRKEIRKLYAYNSSAKSIDFITSTIDGLVAHRHDGTLKMYRWDGRSWIRAELYTVKYISCIHESAYEIISIHRTKEGAVKAMTKLKNKIFYDDLGYMFSDYVRFKYGKILLSD